VVIPVFNAGPSLVPLVSRLQQTFLRHSLNYEIVLVDDGSPDDSWATIKGMVFRTKLPLKAIRLSRNFGQHAALLCGLGHCRGRYVVTMDDDLQHPPEEIPRLLAELAKGFDLVYGVYQRRGHSWPRVLLSRLSKAVLKLAIPELNPRFTSFRAIRLESVKNILALNTPFTFIDGSLAWVVGKVGWVMVSNAPRRFGRSGYGPRKLLGYTLDILTTFSSLPLRAASVTGFCIALAGFAWGIHLVIQHYVFDNILPGYTSLMAGLLVLNGLVLVAVGINGEYLARVNYKTTGRPRFVEAEGLKLSGR
jgi:polyisoprenyl-phosphate glycosyltransferase